MKNSCIDPWSPTLKCMKNETIGVMAIYPRHFDGLPVDMNSIFSKTQLRAGKLSSSRLSWATPSEIWKEVIGKAKPDSDGRYMVAYGIITGLYSTYRSIFFTSGDHAFEVTPSGSENNRSHADIKFVKLPPNVVDPNIENLTKMRSLLLDSLFTTDSDCQPKYLIQLIRCCSFIKSGNTSHPTLDYSGI